MSRVFAYCRVSTTEQTTDNQLMEIKAAGFEIDPKRIVMEQVSGSVAAMERKGFARLIDRLEADDVLVVTKIDRLGRGLIDVKSTVDRLTAMGVRVHCLALGGVDLTSPAGKMILGILGAFAEFERDLIIERTQAGLARAKAEGVTLGRPVLLDAAQRATVRSALASGASVSAVARDHGISRQTIMRVRDQIVPVKTGERSEWPERLAAD